MPQTYAAGDFFASMFSAFQSAFLSTLNFVTSNEWLLVIVGTPLIIGVIAAIMSFIKSR